MVKCKNCGTDLEDDAQICYGCGNVTIEPVESRDIKVNEEKKTIKKDKKPIVFGILSLVFSVTILLGIIFAIIGLKMSKKQENKAGKVLSTIGLILSILVFVSIAAYVLFSIYLIITVTKALSGASFVFL